MNISFASQLLISGLCLLSLSSGFAAERPNVLLILVDDLKPALGLLRRSGSQDTEPGCTGRAWDAV